MPFIRDDFRALVFSSDGVACRMRFCRAAQTPLDAPTSSNRGSFCTVAIMQGATVFRAPSSMHEAGATMIAYVDTFKHTLKPAPIGA